MKQQFLIMLILLNSIAGLAQKKHSVSFGLELSKHSYHKEWDKSSMIIFDHFDLVKRDKSIFHAVFPWIQYYYNNKYALRLYKGKILQGATYKYADETPPFFPSAREAFFYEALIGYNISQLLEDKLSITHYKNISLWFYAGGTYHDEAVVYYVNYFPISHHTYEYDYGDYSARVRPVFNLQIKYNPVKFIMLGVSGTYRHIGKDFKPVSGNLSLGVQI